nr:unnamed protein product [Callosobruchus chinensis]
MNEDDIKIELNKIEHRVCIPKKFKKVIDRLLKLGYDGFSTDSNGITPIIYAAKYNHKELLESLLIHFKDVDIDNNIFSKKVHIETNLGDSLFDGTSYANSNLIKIVNTHDPNGNSALYYAVDNKSFDIACILLLHGADISYLDKEKLKEILLYSVEEILDVHYMEEHKLSPIVGLLSIKVPEALKYDRRTFAILLRRFIFCGHSKVVVSLIDSVQDQNKKKLILDEVYNGTSLLDIANSHLSKICDYDHLQIVKYLFEQGATNTCNQVDPVYLTLSSSAQKGHLDTFQYLVKKTKNENFNTYIGLATIDHRIDIIAFIWDNYREYTTDRVGNTALHYATWRGSLESIKYLCENGADANINATNNKGETPLDNAIEGNRKEVIKYLILQYDAQPGASPYMQAAYKRIKRFLDANHNDLENLLLEAIVASDLPLMENILAQGVDINRLNASGMTPLHLAAQNISGQATKFLLQHGAVYDIPARNNETALKLSRYDNAVILNLVDKLFKSSNLTQEFKKIIGMFVRYDDAYDPDNPMVFLMTVKNRKGQTFLHKAVDLNDKDATNLLIEYNKSYIVIKRSKLFPTVEYYVPMNVAAQDFEGNTPLHLAAQNGNIEIATQLIDEDHNMINIKTILGIRLYLVLCAYECCCSRFEGNTPLHLAAQNCNIEIATQLIDEDHNMINIKNNLGHTALFVAGHHKHKSFVELLLKMIDKQSTSNQID